jgi:hypothetical protein
MIAAMKINGAECTFVNIINTLTQLARTHKETHTLSPRSFPVSKSLQQTCTCFTFEKAAVCAGAADGQPPLHSVTLCKSPFTRHMSYGKLWQLEYVIFTQSCSAVHLSLLLSLPSLHKLQNLVCGQGAQATPKIKSKE